MAQPAMQASSLPLITADREQEVKGRRAARDSVFIPTAYSEERGAGERVCLLVHISK